MSLNSYDLSVFQRNYGLQIMESLDLQLCAVEKILLLADNQNKDFKIFEGMKIFLYLSFKSFYCIEHLLISLFICLKPTLFSHMGSN